MLNLYSHHMRTSLVGAFLLLSAATIQAQDVNRSKYPDYSVSQTPDPTLSAIMAKRVQTAAQQRPSHVNNAEQMFFPPIFNQDGGSCGSASHIRYMFTNEINSYRNISSSSDATTYPSHFVWLLTNGNSGKDEFVQYIGVPTAEVYGGRTYSALFGYQEESDNDFGWMTGYDKWYSAMFNRMLKPTVFPLTVATEEGRELVKNWLWNHNGDTSFHGGGVCCIGVASNGDWQKIAKTDANDAAGATGKYFVNKWGTSVDHALTIVGYDDSIEFDLNGNGIYGEADADELGAWIIANSWGDGWCNDGLIYCPYAHGGAWFNADGTFGDSWWAPGLYRVRKDYRPLRTIRLKMDYSRRSEIYLSAGIATDLNATEPERAIAFDHFKFAGDGNNGNTNPAPEIPMLGRWADGKLHDEPMEFGYDLTDLTSAFDANMPLKYFFIVETRPWGLGSGHIYDASIIDYQYDANGMTTPFDLPAEGTTITSAGNKTIISTIVYGHGYYAPQNVCYADSLLTWDSPIASGHDVTAYNIYREGELAAKVDAVCRSFVTANETEQVTYAVTAVYDTEESAQAAVNTPVPQTGIKNTTVNLKETGFTVPDVFQTKYDDATIEFWINPTTLADWNQSAGSWGSFMFHANSNGAFTAGWATGEHRVDGTAGDLKVGTWTHVAMVVHKNLLNVYINGVRKGSITSSQFSGLGGFGDLNFIANGSGAWNARIDELRIWNCARTSEQISSCKNTCYTGSRMPESLVAYYNGATFTRDGITYLRDCAGGHHAPIADASKAMAITATMPSLKAPTQPLTATINSPGDIYAGCPATFTATCSESTSRTAWEADGNARLFTATPTFTFASEGQHTVTLTAFNAAGDSIKTSLDVTVLPAPAADATFTATASEVPTGENVTFIAAKPRLGYLYEWLMPGASLEHANTVNASASYPVAGTYTVTLNVTAPDGSKQSSQQTVTVVDVAPEAAFAVSPAVVLKGEKVTLNDESRHAPTAWTWTLHSDIKDYYTNEQSPVIAPLEPGIYDITLTARNAEGQSSASRSRALTVCNADSRNGLNFGNSVATATAEGAVLASGDNAFTIECWLKPSKNTDYCNAIGDTETTMLLRTDSKGALRLSVNGKESISANDIVIPGEWHHYAVTFGNSTVRFYRDGKLMGQKALSAFLPTPVTRFALGSAEAPMNGCIDELRLWNKVRTLTQLKALANQPIEDIAAAEAEGLVIYYDFNQSGGNVADRTSHALNATRSGFGPDGDAWGLSSGVFCLNFGSAATATDVTAAYLTNYKKPFSYDSANKVNNSVANRFYAINDWQLEGNPTTDGITTGVHVDNQKSYCMTCTTQWDGFASSLNNHAVYQTITLPAGSYIFTASYDDSHEGQSCNSYLAVAEGHGLPAANLPSKTMAYKAMAEKSATVTSNSLTFVLGEETTVSLGMVVNMSGYSCMNIKEFSLKQKPIGLIENGIHIEETTSAKPVTNAYYDLSGRRIAKPAKHGVYIHDGKKILVK